ncbi:carboxyl transferase domain-containing protein [Dunaliella salina]|uniref:Carboxyl transferase domain-containing protein n=1 Tax=Dunaliella salina TaxID=3046 RepID=A0ABQ7G2L6_DUNSA|nr:carboxyl transferase domain-containing protein [Dunaliella salina]|eukprot:KAF5828836.1 carboxyl transferase domain-containing protein [Dunaliella salina]
MGDLRAAVARALSGLDMFSNSSAAVATNPLPGSNGNGKNGGGGLVMDAAAAAAAQATTPVKVSAIPRRDTVLEGWYNGLPLGLMPLGSPPGGPRKSAEGKKSVSRTSSRSTGLSPVASATPGDGSGAVVPRTSTSLAIEAKMEMLVTVPAAVEEPLASLVVDPAVDPALHARALVTYVRRLYHSFLLREPVLQNHASGLITLAWLFEEPHLRCASPPPTPRAGALVYAPSVQLLPEAILAVRLQLQGLGMDMGRQGSQQMGCISEGTVGCCLHVALPGDDGPLQLACEAARVKLRALSGSSTDLTSMADVAAEKDGGKGAQLGESEEDIDAAVRRALTAIVTPHFGAIAAAGFQCLSLLARSGGSGGGDVPVRMGWAWDEATHCFKPDRFLGQVEPISACSLELTKMAAYRLLTYAPSRNRQWHFYTATERPDAKSYPMRRMFVRGLMRQLGSPALLAASYSGNSGAVANAAVCELEPALVGCLEELGRLQQTASDATAERPDWTHIFCSVLPPLPLPPPPHSGSSPTKASAVACLELRFRGPLREPAWRVVASLPSGHEHGEEHVDVYREVYESCPAQSLASHPVSVEDASAEPTQQQPTNRIERTRSVVRLVYRAELSADQGEPAAATLQHELRQQIAHARQLQQQQAPTSLSTFATPEAAQSASAAAASGAGKELVPDLHGESVLGPYPPLQPLQQRRLAARRHNVTYCYDFPAVFETALREIWAARAAAGEPNAFPPSGRLCVAEELGFQYLYLTEADYATLEGMAKQTGTELVRAVKQPGSNGESSARWVLQDVVGLEDGLGVECLSGSGAIASAFNRVFREGFSVTLVSGRTVGIGAYLARLGRRCVQRTDQPIILTGFAALNKLLGRQVYTSHMQLGGPRVMGVNGVSHHLAADDLDGVRTMLHLLSFCPPDLGTAAGAPTHPCLPSSDPITRPITYAPGPVEKLDPRAAIAGRPAPQAAAANGNSSMVDKGRGAAAAAAAVATQDAQAAAAAGAGIGGNGGGVEAEECSWQSGMFDKGSWEESQASWARTVVTGRARLGGQPVGVIAVETGVVSRLQPADPGMPDSSEMLVPQAGQVWYPDSAAKTAAAIEEFALERLPLIILANWRGFSGGQGDLFAGVLQKQMGGAWVVVDSCISSEGMIEMYADPTARGGVLEPEGVVEIKFRTPDLLRLMHRCGPFVL